MAKYILRQGSITANLSDVIYRREEGFLEDNTWHVHEATITAESDVKLTTGPATILHGEQSYNVAVTVWEPFSAEEDEQREESEPTCTIDIDYLKGVAKLGSALGLVEDLKPKTVKR